MAHRRKPMKIGIIGAGNIGGTLTRRLRELGHEVFVANWRGPEWLPALADVTGATAVSVGQAARSATVGTLTLPLDPVPELPANLFPGVPADIIAADTGTY